MGDRGKVAARPLRTWRLNAGLTLDELAVAAHVARNTLKRLEEGGRSTLYDHEGERRVARALGIEPEAIAWGVEVEVEPVVSVLALRRARGLEPADVAARTGVPIKTIVRAEAGAAIHPRYAKRLGDFYGVAVCDFYPHARRAAA